MTRAQASHEVLAREFARAVCTDGTRCVEFVVRGRPLGVVAKHVIRTHMKEHDVVVGTETGQVAWSECVDGKGDLGLVLGTVNKVVGRHVDDQFRLDGRQCRVDGSPIRDVDLVQVEGSHVPLDA